jgi:hypothetical protein
MEIKQTSKSENKINNNENQKQKISTLHRSFNKTNTSSEKRKSSFRSSIDNIKSKLLRQSFKNSFSTGSIKKLENNIKKEVNRSSMVKIRECKED